MYSLIEKFKFFPTEFPTDPFFMHLLADHIYERYNGTNAEILIAWLKAGEWLEYLECDTCGSSGGCASGGGFSHGVYNGNGYCRTHLISGSGNGYGDGIGYGTSESGCNNGLRIDNEGVICHNHNFDSGEGIGNGNGVSYGLSSGGGQGYGGSYYYENVQNASYYIRNNFTIVKLLKKIDFEIKFQKDQYVITLDQEGGCFYGQYKDHNGREVQLNNARHINGWRYNTSIHDVISDPSNSNVQIGSISPEMLVLLACIFIIEVPEKQIQIFNALPYIVPPVTRTN